MQPQTPVLDDSNKLKKNFIGMHSGLALQFVAGLVLATLADYNPDATEQSMAHNVFLGIHTVLGFLLLIGATQILVRTTKRPGRRWTAIGWIGLGNIITALASGVLVIVGPWHEFFAFTMGLGFIAALMVYAYGLYYIREQ